MTRYRSMGCLVDQFKYIVQEIWELQHDHLSCLNASVPSYINLVCIYLCIQQHVYFSSMYVNIFIGHCVTWYFFSLTFILVHQPPRPTSSLFLFYTGVDHDWFNETYSWPMPAHKQAFCLSWLHLVFLIEKNNQIRQLFYRIIYNL